MKGCRFQNIQTEFIDSFLNFHLLIAWNTFIITRYVDINSINLNDFEVFSQSIEELF